MSIIHLEYSLDNLVELGDILLKIAYKFVMEPESCQDFKELAEVFEVQVILENVKLDLKECFNCWDDTYHVVLNKLLNKLKFREHFTTRISINKIIKHLQCRLYNPNSILNTQNHQYQKVLPQSCFLHIPSFTKFSQQ